MKNVASKLKEKKSYDRRDWPSKGDENIQKTYAAVGSALSQWERYEGSLSLLFSALISGAETPAARKSYNAVRTFQGRLEMLEAASKTHFQIFHSDQLQKKFKIIWKNAKSYSERRNEIAHGVVDYYRTFPPSRQVFADETYCLYPSYSTFKNRTLDDMPEYCYTSVELDYFYAEFYLLNNPVIELAGALILEADKRAFRNK